MVYERSGAPAWLPELESRCRADRDLFSSLVREIMKHTGMPKELADRTLRGGGKKSDLVVRIIMRGLELPNPDDFWNCPECNWIGKELHCLKTEAGEMLCPACHSLAYIMPVDYEG